MMSISKDKKAFTWIIVLFPILFEYSGGMASLKLSDDLLIIFLIAVIIKRKIYLNINKKILPIAISVVYLYIDIVIEMVAGIDMSIVLKLARYLLYMTTVIFFANEYLDANYTIRSYKIAAVLATVMLFLQLISYYFLKKQLLGFIPFLPRGVADDYQTHQYIVGMLTTYRPCSFFSEPAIFATYVAGMLTIELFNTNRNMKLCIFLTLGMILSTSSTALIYVVVIWLIWAFWAKRGLLYTKRLAIIALFFLAGIPFLGTTSIRYIVGRIFINRLGIGGRFEGYLRLINAIKNDGLINLLFGHTMYIDKRVEYVPGWGSYLYSFGLIGLFLLITGMISICKESNDIGKALIICLAVLSIGTVVLINYFAMIFLSLAIVVGQKEFINTKDNLVVN